MAIFSCNSPVLRNLVACSKQKTESTQILIEIEALGPLEHRVYFLILVYCTKEKFESPTRDRV
jgi:hypothetical protein